MIPHDLILPGSIAACVVALLLATKRLSVFHATGLYLLFHFVAYGIRPALLAFAEPESIWAWLRPAPEPDAMRHALWASSVALVVFCLAYLFGSRRARPLEQADEVEMDSSDRRALLLVALCFAVPGVGAGFLVYQQPHSLAGIADVVYLALPVAALAATAGRFRWWSFVPLGGWAWLRSTVAPVPEAVGVTVLVGGLLWAWHRRRAQSLRLPLAGILLLGLAALALDGPGLWQGWVSDAERPRSPRASETSLVQRIDHPHVAHAEALAGVIATVPATHVYSYGAHHLDALLGRARSKSPLLSLDARAPGPRFGAGRARSMPLGLAGDAWWSGGWSGLVIVFAASGILLGALFTWASRRQGALAVTTGFCAMQALAAVAFWTGDLATLARTAVLTTLPLACWSFLSTRFRRARAAAAERERLREERQQRRVLGSALISPHAAAPGRSIERRADPDLAANAPMSAASVAATLTDTGSGEKVGTAPSGPADPVDSIEADKGPRTIPRWRQDEPGSAPAREPGE